MSYRTEHRKSDILPYRGVRYTIVEAPALNLKFVYQDEDGWIHVYTMDNGKFLKAIRAEVDLIPEDAYDAIGRVLVTALGDD